MPTRHPGGESTGRPWVRTSPPAFTKKHDAPAARSISPARATAHPFTMPDGSSGARPGRGVSSARAPNEMSNAPLLSSRICSLNASTSRTSGFASSTRSSPRPICMISVSERQVLKRSSTCRNHRKHASATASSIGSRTSTVITVPHCSSVRRSGHIRALPELGVRLVERALQRLRVAVARVRSSGDEVDLRALRLQRFLAEVRPGLLADVLPSGHDRTASGARSRRRSRCPGASLAPGPCRTGCRRGRRRPFGSRRSWSWGPMPSAQRPFRGRRAGCGRGRPMWSDRARRGLRRNAG